MEEKRRERKTKKGGKRDYIRCSKMTKGRKRAKTKSGPKNKKKPQKSGRH